MFELLKVAVRNVGRNKRRSLITMLTILMGVLVITAIRGLLNGLHTEIRSSLTRKVNGDLQIHLAGYQDSIEGNPFRTMFRWDEETQRTVLEAPGVEAAAARMRVMGLLNHQRSQTTFPMVVMAIDSEAESVVCPRLREAVQLGQYIDSRKESFGSQVQDESLAEARGLDEAGETGAVAATKAEGFHQIMVTPSILRGLKAEIGDEVVLLLQDEHQMQQALIAHITGVVDYGLPNMSGRLAWMDYGSLARVLGVEGKASEVALRSAPGVRVGDLKALLNQRLGPETTVETWEDVSGFFRDALRMQNVIFSIILVIVFTIVVFAIINTSLMTVMERTREIGTLMALGYRRRHILFLFLAELACIGLAGGLAGVALSVGGLQYLGYTGIRFSYPGQVGEMLLFPHIGFSYVLFVLALAVGAALLAGFVPAFRASRMRPVEALSST